MSGWLRGSKDDPSTPDYALDHACWGGFYDSKFLGCEVASEEASLDATKATGKRFDNALTEEEFDRAVVEGEAWEDMEGSWLR